jgi:hypothetical protein
VILAFEAPAAVNFPCERHHECEGHAAVENCALPAKRDVELAAILGGGFGSSLRASASLPRQAALLPEALLEDLDDL